MLALTFSCIFLASTLLAAGQTAPHVTKDATAAQPVQFDISPPLREMAQPDVPFFGMHEASPVLKPKLQQLMEAAKQGVPTAEDPALQKYVGPFVNTTPGLNLLGVGHGFPGYSVPDAPPDTNMAVGDTQVVQWVNVSYAVFDKVTGAVIPCAAGHQSCLGNQFWSGFGGACQSQNSGDIIAQYDKVAHRWFMTQNTFSTPYMTCIAVSTTDDATGSYFRYAYNQSRGFPDSGRKAIRSH
jgi:hypothetical protein